MSERSTNLIRLYLPLLTHELPEVRHQAALLLACSQGSGGLAALRMLTQDPEGAVRRQARSAIEALGEVLGSSETPTMTPPLFVTCLGSLRVSAGGAWLSERDWSPADGGRAGWQKVQSTFAFLVHVGRHGTTRRALGEAVWGGSFSPTSLSRTLTTLRQALERVCGQQTVDDALLFGEDRCRLDPALYEADVDVFERTYALACGIEEEDGLQKAGGLYAQVMDLYGGPYMSDIAPGSGWMQQRRELLASYYLVAAERLADDAFARSDFRRCILVCLRALQAEPAADDIVSWMMRAYARLGHYNELEYAYRSYIQATGIEVEAADPHDVVVTTYRDLLRSRAVNDRGVTSAE